MSCQYVGSPAEELATKNTKKHKKILEWDSAWRRGRAGMAVLFFVSFCVFRGNEGSMVEQELARVEQHPEQVLHAFPRRFGGLDPVGGPRRFFGVRRPRECHQI